MDRIEPKPIPTWRKQGGRGSRSAPAKTGWYAKPTGAAEAYNPRPKAPPPPVQKTAKAGPCLTCQRFVKPPYKHCFYCYQNMTESQKREARKLWPK